MPGGEDALGRFVAKLFECREEATGEPTDDEVSKDDVTTGTPTDEPTEGDSPKDESNSDEL